MPSTSSARRCLFPSVVAPSHPVVPAKRARVESTRKVILHQLPYPWMILQPYRWQRLIVRFIYPKKSLDPITSDKNQRIWRNWYFQSFSCINAPPVMLPARVVTCVNRRSCDCYHFFKVLNVDTEEYEEYGREAAKYVVSIDPVSFFGNIYSRR